MNTAMRVGIALGGAAVVIAGGSAFTAGNTDMPATKMAGYGETQTTGVTVTKTTYTPKASEPSQLEEVVWETSTAIATATHTATLTLKTSGATVTGTCVIAGAGSPYTITCDAGDTEIAGITYTGLTVVAKPA